MPRALLVVPDNELCAAIEEIVAESGFAIDRAVDLPEARRRFDTHWPDLVIADFDLPGGTVTELLDELDEGLRPEVVFVVDENRADEVLSLLRHGASDYLTRQLDPKRLRAILSHVARTRELFGELSEARDELQRMGRFGRFVGASAPMRKVYDRIARVAPSDATVLVAGESGTGKEVVARTLHELSRRRGRPFCPVNCGAMADELLESELFGHEKGAFTGADRRHRGWFERADGGTLFLDEITEMPADSQVKLLRVLETGKVIRVGGERQIQVDTRVVAATNRNVEEAVESGDLREDLYYRLKVFRIWVPPLRDRGGDIELLAHFFLEERNRRDGDNKRFAPGALEHIAGYDWPGNVRELKNAVRSGYILADEEIDVDCLPPEVAGAEPRPTAAGSVLRVRIGSRLADVERRLILATLDHFDGNKTRAAAALGIAKKTLYNRLNAYDDEPEPRA
jgi:DNA-binding NtrC family response regulator